MKPHLTVVLALLLLAPLGALGWLGVRAARNDQRLAQLQFDEQIDARLAEAGDKVGRSVEHAGLALDRLLDFEAVGAEPLRALASEEPMVRQVFLLSPSGRLLHPPLEEPRTRSEEAFLTRTESIWQSGERFTDAAERPAKQAAPGARPDDAAGVAQDQASSSAPPGAGGGQAPTSAAGGADVELVGTGGAAADRRRAAGSRAARGDGQAPVDAGLRAAGSSASASQAAHGWYVWYWDRDVNLIYWKRASDGRTLGIEANVMALLADIIGALPSDDPLDPAQPLGRMELADADGDVLYAWGRHRPAEGEGPRATRPLGAPLGSWSVRYFPAPEEVARAIGTSGKLATYGALGALMLALAALAVYFVRESGRELREAEQRVSFVNQVSHELKTPLTHIRMYAELLDERLEDEGDDLRDYTGVIVAESQRLSRLIANVLSFARHKRGKLALRKTEGDVDQTIAQVVDQFRPSLEERGLAVELRLDAAGRVRFDADALGQILGNLLNNVEKYAVGGKRVRVSSERRGSTATIRVADDGPGIPERSREEIFEPFVRLSGALTDGVAGTGIGLSIARELARLHGGELRLEPSDTGAAFHVTFEVDPEKGGGREGPDRRG